MIIETAARNLVRLTAGKDKHGAWKDWYAALQALVAAVEAMNAILVHLGPRCWHRTDGDCRWFAAQERKDAEAAR
jgi:hypothetical protein